MTRLLIEAVADTMITDHVIDSLEDVLDEHRGFNWYECKQEDNWEFERTTKSSSSWKGAAG